MATFGDTSIEASPIGLSSTNFWAFKFTLPANGTITGMEFYCNPPGGAEQANLGLYADSSNSPGALLGSTGNFVLNAGAGWNVASLLTPYVATSGSYWLAVLAPTGFGGIDNLAYQAAAGTSWFVSGVGASLPNPRTGGSLGTDLISVYATYTASGGGPVNTVAPAVTGIVAVGKTLSCTTGTWTGDTSSGFAYQWKDASGNISSATSSTYVVGSGEATRSLHCTVTATGTGGSTAQDSNTVGPIGTSTGNLSPRMEFQSEIIVEWIIADVVSIEMDRTSVGAGLGLGSIYEFGSLSRATTAASAENSRVNAGLGLGCGSHINYTNVSPTSSESVDESNRVKNGAGIGGGSQANL